MENKEEIKKMYLHTDVEPTLDRLKSILAVAQNFEQEGAGRLMCALNMKHMDIPEVSRLAEYLSRAREKMEKELARVRELEKDFNSEFATDHNGYYNSVFEMMRHIRSHLSPLRNIFKKFCYRTHIRQIDIENHNISPKSVFDKSILSMETFQPDLFDISDYPPEVQGLFTEMQRFFKAEEYCMRICVDIIEEEARIAKDPVQSKYLLDKYRRKAFQKIVNQLGLFNDEIICELSKLNPAYQRYQVYATEEGFAQGEYHKHNIPDMDHFCIIEHYMAKKNNNLDNDELANWGNNPEQIKMIKYVIEHFDELLPDYFKHKMMGRFQYYFCKWALPGNIKACTLYFVKHYKGKWKTSKYAAVNNHGKEYDQHSEEVENFNTAIQNLLSEAKMTDMMIYSA